MAGLFKNGGPASHAVEGMFALRLRVGQGAWTSDSSYARSIQGVLPTERARCGAARTNPEELLAASYAAALLR